MCKLVIFVAAVLTLATPILFGDTASADNTRKNSNVKLYTNAVEVVDVQPTAEKCTKGKGPLSV